MPEEYRELLTRLLTIQADCEIGGPHIYVDHWTLREELGHVAYGEQQLEKMMATPEGKIAAQLAIDKWYVVGLDMFGRSESARDERYIEWGLKKRTNGKMREDYIAEMDPKISALGLRVPDKLAGRKYL